MKLDNFYHLEYSRYYRYIYCYNHNVVKKNLKKAEGSTGENVVNINMKMKISPNTLNEQKKFFICFAHCPIEY